MLLGVAKQSEQIQNWRSTEVWLALGLIGFAITVLIFQHLHLKSTPTPWSPKAVTQFYGFPLIIFAALLVVVLARPDQQVAPLFGLLGAITGYLIGQSGSGQSGSGQSGSGQSGSGQSSPS